MEEMKMKKMLVLVAMLALPCVASAMVGSGWDYNADFSITNGNPNGVWTYGTITRDTGAFQPYTVPVSSYPNDRWEGNSGPDNDGCVTKDMGDGSYHDDWRPGQAWDPYDTGFMTPISDRTRGTGARFTAPVAGDYYGVVTFENRVIELYDTYVYVNLNGMEVWGDMVTGFRSGPENFATFASPVTLAAGDTIDIYAFSIFNDVEPWDGGDHLVVVDAVISVVPEPITMALLGLGGLALVRRRR